MKQITQNLRWLITLLAMIVSVGAWAAEITKTVNLSAGTYSGGSITWTIDDKITIQQTKGVGANVNSSYIAAPRIYRGNILSFVASNGTKIKSISITYSGSYLGSSMIAGTELNGSEVINAPEIVGCTWSKGSGGTHVVSSESSDGLPVIYIQNGNSSTENVQLWPTKISVTYTTGIQTNVTFNSSYISRTDMAQGTALGQLIAIVKDINNTLITNPTINWESSNEGVATVDANGNVTAVNIGTTIITATFAGDDTYLGSSAKYELTVTYGSRQLSTLIFTEACGGSGTADDNTLWIVSSDANESTYESDRGIHYGTGSSAVSYLTLTTSGISGIIKEIVVNTSGASGTSAIVSVTIAGNSFGDTQSITSSATNYTFCGSASGTIVVRVSQNSARKALYVKSITVTYEPQQTTTVAPPTFNPESGTTFSESLEISLSADNGCEIWYTTDGTDPSASNGTLYEDEITISATTTVKAIAIKDNESSEIASATYEKVLLSAGLEYSASIAEVTFKETPYTLPTFSNPYVVAVTYSSLNEAVATVNSTTGEVTICGVGTTTITATFAGNDDFKAGSASYTLIVNPVNTTEIDLVNNESVTFTKDSWTNVSSGSYPSGETEKPFIGSDGTSTTWNYKNVLRLTNELQFKASEGLLSSPKVSCLDGYGYKVTIRFTSGVANPSGSLVVTASTGENASKAAPSSGIDASLSLDVCGWSNVTISTTCSNALYVKEIKFERIEVETVNITISDKAKIDNEYYATFSNSEKALHFGAVKGLKAYTVETAEKESSAITLSEVTKVPANTGLLVCGTTPKTYKVPVIPSTSADEILVNMLHPSTGMTGDGKSIYIFANGNKGLGFYIVKNGSSLNPNQAYLKINNGTSSEIKTFFSLGGDYVNDINHIETEILSDNIGVYNLNGQRVTSPVKGGLYIMNGKKVFVR